MEEIRKELDKEFLNSYYKDMVNEVGEIFQLFLEETPTDIVQITNSFSELKYKEVAEGLHKIAPCFYNVGLPQLTTLVQKIEAAVHEGKHDESLTKFQEFKIELDQYLPAIKEEHVRLMTFQ